MKEYLYRYGSKIEDVNKVEKKLSELRKIGEFKGEKDISIYYEKYIVENSKKAIVISHGFSECIEKYHELIYYFLNKEISVFIMEHRGHGRSGCLSEICSTQVEIEKFEYYISDLKLFIDNIVLNDKVYFNDNLYLFAHSMGGAIATIFLEENQGYFKKVILNSPMFRINTGKHSYKKCKVIAKLLILLGKGNRFIFGQKPFEEKEDIAASGTSDEYRHGVYHKILLENQILRRGGGSIHWYNEAVKATEYLMKDCNISEINVPILLFKSEFDDYVDIAFHEKFKRKVNGCKIIELKESKHEGFLEKDEILCYYLKEIFRFLKDN